MRFSVEASYYFFLFSSWYPVSTISRSSGTKCGASSRPLWVTRATAITRCGSRRTVCLWNGGFLLLFFFAWLVRFFDMLTFSQFLCFIAGQKQVGKAEFGLGLTKVTVENAGFLFMFDWVIISRHYPIGVLYDLLNSGSDDNIPWSVTVHFKVWNSIFFIFLCNNFSFTLSLLFFAVAQFFVLLACKFPFGRRQLNS